MHPSIIFAVLFLFASIPYTAHAAEGLPGVPAYKGDIRRGADGRLIVVEEDLRADRVLDASRPATLIVGPDERVKTITEAARMARNGDVIEIRSGDYRGQPAIWTQNNLVIRGEGKRPVLAADGKSAEGKGLWVIRGGMIHIENLEFRGARVNGGNGAGIRFERGHLIVNRCAFADNEMGILTGNTADMTLTVTDSEFSDAPRDETDVHHLLYVGAIGKFVLSGSRFWNGYRGHLVKSRARENQVRNNLLADGPGGRASYELEFPNGGIAYVVGNLIAQSESTDNPEMVSYGAEGNRWPDNALYLAHNTLVNDRHNGGKFLRLWPENFPQGMESWIINNLTVGNGDLFAPPQGRFEGNVVAPRADLVAYAGLPLRLKPDSPLRGSVRVPGKARDEELLPNAEFTLPTGRRPIHPGSSLAPGALQ